MLAMCGALLLFTITMQAAAMEKKATVTISEKAKLPGETLDPGTYIFKIQDSMGASHEMRPQGQAGQQATGQMNQFQSGQRHVVHVVKQGQESKPLVTCIAIPNSRLSRSGSSDLLFWNASGNDPKAVRAVFISGENAAYEFAWPESEAKDISGTANEQVPMLTDADEKLIDDAEKAFSDRAEAFKESGEKTAATQQERRIDPVTGQERRTDPVTGQERRVDPVTGQERPVTGQETSTLPATASPMPLIGIIGLAALAAGLLFHTFRHNS
jgi:LPXTG-motif cell wall-anchored protein